MLRNRPHRLRNQKAPESSARELEDDFFNEENADLEDGELVIVAALDVRAATNRP